MASPSFTVLIPAYNSAATLSAAIDSVLAQTYPAEEIVVVDDGSTDDTATVAESFGTPVRVVRKPNGGTASARNRGIAEAAGEVVAFLDADDVYLPTHLEEIATALRARPHLAGAATDAELRGAERSWRNSDYWPKGAPRDRIDLRTPLIFCALAVRTEVLRAVGEFDSRFYILEDVEMRHRLVCAGYEIGYVNSPSYIYTIHAQSKSQSERAVRGRLELLRINLRYLLAPKTPMHFRPRLAVRAGQQAVAAVRAAAAR
jgi:glycosyltransferase involved in cell wall biosynthesis